MADFATMAKAEDGAKAKMADGTYVVAAAFHNAAGAPAMYVLNTMANGGGWAFVTEDPLD